MYLSLIHICFAEKESESYEILEAACAYTPVSYTHLDHGVGYTQAAIDSLLPGTGSGFVAIAIFFFTLTTLVAFAFNTDAGMSYIFRKKSRRTQKIAINSVLFAMVAITFFGSMTSTAVAWNIADMGTAILAWVNLPAIILLSPKVIKIFRDYDRQRKMGLDPVFEPSKLSLIHI